MDIAEQVRTLLATKFGVDPHAVTPEAPLRTLGVDSLALEELRLHIEDRLDVDLEDVQLTPRDTVGQLLAAVCAVHMAHA
ncbi:acyl carrier protein [Streptomyces halobius]|uniref:Acyl carrier protein n=1 Tax=Streptomyces halobius TaxID=2879846 RepID=A0ABY4MB64_9ACTN|nr:acyl carrier protein [Streptomyces halobius]UQA95014.1 acyl carrier protein [Streptomyces halobius]